MLILFIYSTFIHKEKNSPTQICQDLFYINAEMDKNVITKTMARITTKEELLDLLNRLKEEDARQYGFTFYPFQMKQINYYCNPSHSKRYHQFTIPKKSGGTRTISSPANELKNILSYLNLIFKAMYNPLPCVNGFVEGRNIVDNARTHLNEHYVFNIDLKDFFTSIPQARVWGRLKAKPYSLKQPMANLVAGLCAMRQTTNGKDTNESFVLPQGAPTSPILTNMICERMDWKLSRLARKYHVNYSRYADDMTFSSQHNVYQADGPFRKELKAIIEGEGFRINPDKTRLDKSGSRQEVTGVTVGVKTNVTRSYVKNIRAILHIWEKYGPEAAQQRFLKPYLKEKARQQKGTPHVENVLQGKLLYMKMVKGDDDPTFMALWQRFMKLATPPTPPEKTRVENLPVSPRQQSKPYKSRYHFPKDVVRFLTAFTQRDSTLKYTTHPWDTGSYESFDDFVNQYRIQLDSDPFWNSKGGDCRLYNCDSELYYIVRNFLTTEDISAKNYWGRYRLRIGYLSPKGVMENWLAANPGKQPSEMPLSILPDEYLPKDRKVDGETLVNFDQVINIFKEAIEFRGSNFHDMVRRVFRHPEINFDRNRMDTLKGYNFYTDTYKIERALERIRTNIIGHSGEHKVKVWATGNEDKTQLCLHILHVDSFSDADLAINEKLMLRGKGDLLDLTGLLCGLCNFYVESRFRDEHGNLRHGVISYLYETPDGQPEPKVTWLDDTEAQGFDYILKFYI